LTSHLISQLNSASEDDDWLDSAEALQDHHWTRALKSFIDGAVQMVTLGELSLEDLDGIEPCCSLSRGQP
jgi:hypothetical protein